MQIYTPLIWLFSIMGFSAASGLHYHPEQQLATGATPQGVYVIADNSPYLYHYNMQDAKLSKILLDSAQTKTLVAKAEKDDFEAMYDLGATIVVVGSGSAPNRNKGFIYNRVTKKVQQINLDTLYRQFQKIGGIDHQNFNIEGIAYADQTWYFFNRGNGSKNQNVVFVYKADSTLNTAYLQKKQTPSISAHHISLPSMKGCPSGFSDALLIGDRLYFLATAEDKASNYEDGANKGTYISYLDIHTWTLGPVKSLSKTKKLEGFSLYEKEDQSGIITFLLCEDPDDTTKNSCPIYKYEFLTSHSK